MMLNTFSLPVDHLYVFFGTSFRLGLLPIFKNWVLYSFDVEL